jgi:hypothetical protein
MQTSAFAVPDRSNFSNCRANRLQNAIHFASQISFADANSRHIGHHLPMVCASTVLSIDIPTNMKRFS